MKIDAKSICRVYLLLLLLGGTLKAQELTLGPNECFFSRKGTLQLKGEMAVTDEYNNNKHYERIGNWSVISDAIVWGLKNVTPGNLEIELFAGIATLEDNSEVSIFLDEEEQSLRVSATSGMQDFQSQGVVRFHVDAPGNHEVKLKMKSRNSTGNFGEVQKLVLNGDALDGAEVWRRRWRPAAIHASFLSENDVNTEITVYEKTIHTSEFWSYQVMTTEFGYIGSPILDEMLTGLNFSLWSYGRNDPVPAHHELSHLVAVGGESNYFGRYGHEGTGVKPRGFNPFGSMQTNTYTVALRKKPGDLYNTFWCYFLDPLSGHWELYGCGKKLNSDGQNEYIKTTGGFVEVVGPPNNARTGHRVREVEFRGWRMQTDGSWNVIDRMDAAYNSATSLSNKEWAVNASGDKFVMRMGGFKDSAPDPGILSLPNPPVLPDYLQGESLQELFQMPADFFVLSPENVTDTAVLLRYELQNFGTNPQIMLYYGTEYGLTEGIHADRLIDEIWQEELSVPESWIQQGILEIPLGGLTNATDYYYRLRIENEEGITWSMDTDHFETAAFHNNPPVAVDDSAVTDKNTAVEVEVLANDSDADLDELSVESFTQPANGSTSASPDGSTITYTPDTGFSGVDTFDYVVTDGTDVDTGAVVITINNTHTETGLFVRGDSNGGGGIDVADAVHILFGLYGGLSRDCEDAQDVNDDGSVDLSDAVTLLNHLFLAMPHPPNPFPETGTDPTPDGLGCERM